MLLRDILEGLECDIIAGSADTEVLDITNDSRKAEKGFLYFAIPGAVVDGAKFIPDVIMKGGCVIVTEKDEDELSEILEGEKKVFLKIASGALDATIVRVKDARFAMGMMSTKFYGNPSSKLTVIGITGTKGKTTTSYMIRNMLQAAGKKTGLVGTIEIDDGKEIIPSANTTPESIVLQRKMKDMVDNGLDSVVMEVSSQALKLDRVAGVEFDYGIFTNLSPDHIGANEHADYDEYRDCKKKLFSMCEVGIFNMDDKEEEYMSDGVSCAAITYGKAEGADYRAEGHELLRKDGKLGIRFNLSGKLEGPVEVDLPGEFSIHNSLAAIAVADQMGVPFDKIKDILTTIAVRGRVEMIPISDSFTFMIDYAHNGMSLKSLLRAIGEYDPQMVITIFGCGGNRDKSRRYEMGEVSGHCSDFTIITSDNPRNEEPLDIMKDIETGIKKTDGEYIMIEDRKEAIRYAIMNAQEGDVIVLAGKGHEDYQEIKGVKYHMDERELVKEVLEEEDVTKICGYNNRYFA